MRTPRAILFVLFVSHALGSTAYGAENQEIKRVRVIFGFESFGLWEQRFLGTISQAIITDPRVVLTPEFLPLDTVGSDSFTLFSEYDRIRPSTADLIIAVQPEAAALVNRWTDTFFPDIPILYALPDNETANAVIGAGSSTILPSAIDAAARETLEIVPQLIPDLEHLYILSGSSPGDNTYLERLRSILVELNLPVETHYLVGLTPSELVEELSTAPPNSAAVFGTYSRDHTGQTYNSRDLILLTRENINIPLFGLVDNTLGAGVVGGSMTSAILYAEKIAETMLSILYGDSPPNSLETVTGFFFDDEQLDRFNIDKRLLPADSTIINQTLGILELYFWQLIIGFAIIATQMFFIVALGSSLQRRRKAERERDTGIVVQENQEKLIESSENRLNEAQRMAKIGSWELDLVTDELIWSDEIFNMFEIDKSRFPATYEAFLNGIHPEDRDRVNQAYNDSLVNHSPYEIFHRLEMPDGRIKHVRETCESYFDNAGNPLRSVGTVQDISEQHRTEEELRVLALIVRNSPDFIGIANIEGAPIFLNNAGRELVGLVDGDDFSKILMPDFFPPKESQRVTDEILPSVLETGRWAGEVYFRHFVSNENIPVWFDIFRIDNLDTGKPTHFGTVTRDIRQQKLTEAELERHRGHLEELVLVRTQKMQAAQEEAERASMAKSDFLSRMSHELRTPLNAILGFGQLMELDQDSPLNESQLENVTEILIAGDHLLSLINEVLDLSSIESGHLKVDLQTIEIAPIVATCVSQVRPLAASREITINIQPAEICAAIADELRLKEILLNLLSNAIKFNRIGGNVEVGCSQVKPGWLRVNVQDTGRGIDADAMEQLYVPFERLSSAYDGIEGTGIGLALVKKLVEGMHGHLGVDSKPGEGSTFWFELPIAETGANKADPVPELLATPSTGSYRVLYVEDNPANLLVAQKALAMRKEIELVDASNAEAGLEIARSRTLDLILLDINLPDMNGFEALKQLRADSKTQHIPVIAVSANAMASDLKQADSAGFAAYLVKPIDIREFYRVIDHWLQIAD